MKKQLFILTLQYKKMKFNKKQIQKIIKESILNYIQEQKIHNHIMEGFNASISQQDLPKEFAEINKQIFGDKTPQELNKISKKYTNNGFQYKNDAKKPHLGKHKAEIETENKGSVFPFGNVKLSNHVLIINMTSALHCPSARFCPIGKESCYAFGDERRREDYWKRNARNEIMFDMARENPSKWKYIFWFIRKYIEKALDSGHIIKHVRLNEAGDFKTPEDVIQFDKFAEEIKRDYDIDTHAYTANKNLIDALNNVKNININASIPEITGEKVYRHFYGVKEEILNKLPDTSLKGIATPLLQQDKKYGLYYKCPCDIAEGAKCYKCQVCWLAKPGIAPNGDLVPKFNVLCAIHGVNKNNFNQGKADKKRKLNEEESITPMEQQISNIKQMIKVARNSEKNSTVN